MRFANIQLLRLIAALGVVSIHLAFYSQFLFQTTAFPVESLHLGPWGSFAVPLFFAISGFVLTHALHSASTGRFLLARFLRLYPGYWLAVGVCLLTIRYTVWPDWFKGASPFNWKCLALAPIGPGKCHYYLGIEWSLIYEVFLSVSLAALSILGVRRGLPLAVLAWVGVLAWKVATRPGYGTDALPVWKTIWLSACNAPFLLGVLAYYLRNRGHEYRWWVYGILVVVVMQGPKWLSSPEHMWCFWAVCSATAVWFLVQIPQVSDRNPLARLGDCSYGLFLTHVTILHAAFFLFLKKGWLLNSTKGVLAAGAAAVVLGLLFGAVESWVHYRLRPLARVKVPERLWSWVPAKLGLFVRRPATRA
jgi:peptidoglycan/LPS O-acetylase OafA/YrhL